MTINEVLEQQNNREVYLNYLGDLLWNYKLDGNYLFRKFLQMEAKEKVVQSINTEKFYWELGSQIWEFYGEHFISIAEYALKELDGTKIVDLVMQTKTPKHIIFNYFNDRKYKMFLKHIENKVLC